MVSSLCVAWSAFAFVVQQILLVLCPGQQHTNFRGNACFQLHACCKQCGAALNVHELCRLTSKDGQSMQASDAGIQLSRAHSVCHIWQAMHAKLLQ